MARHAGLPLLAFLALLTGLTGKPLTAGAAAQPKQLNVEDIYGNRSRDFGGSFAASMTWAPDEGPWIDDGQYLWPDFDDGAWMRVDARSGTARPLVTSAQIQSALRGAGAAADDAAEAVRRLPSGFNLRRDALLLTAGGDLYRHDIPSARAARLTNSPDLESEAMFSPDGQTVAFIRNNNLLVTSGGGEHALTSDGSRTLLNGILDWVYSEELYGRANHRAYWWSPDSQFIAFLQLDETAVPEYTLVDDIPYRPDVKRWHYPKAGDPNPTVKLGIVPAAGGVIRWVDTSAYTDFLIVDVSWTPDSTSVVFQVQDRQQTWLELNRADVTTGRIARLLRETTQTWVERWQESSAGPLWLKDGSFLWLSERSGWRHVYHYSANGTLQRQVTSGNWEVRRLHGVDPPEKTLFIDATAHTPIGQDLYRVRLDGSGLARLTEQEGSHRPFLTPSRELYLDSWSDINTPPQVSLYRTGTPRALRVVDANRVQALSEFALATPELMQVKARDGFVMEAMMIKPADFSPSRKYPVYQYTYGGPHNPRVSNSWGGRTNMYHQLLAQRGVIVWVMDNRTASGKGMVSAWPLYRNLGVTELSDIEDGVAWLKQQPFVDGSRLGIAGVSYGAFVTLYALTHSRSFAMGIAEGAVTDWRNYDSIYTERYMGLPHDNPDGYRRSSPRFDADRLAGNLLLIHGTLDDNVHPQNAMQFAHELQRSGKQFQMMLYPKSDHGVSGARLEAHVRNMMLDFTIKNLLR